MTEKKQNTNSFKLGFNLQTRLEAACERSGRKKSSFIREAIEEKLDAMERPKFDTPPMFDRYYGQYREFEIGGQRIAVAITPWRNEPVVVFHILGDQPHSLSVLDLNANEDHFAVVALLDMEKTNKYYHWETPEFREFCGKVGLDPDAIKPPFAEAHQALARVLLERSCRYDQFEGDLKFYRNYIQDLLDLIRTDTDGCGWDLENKFRRCCRDFVDWEGEPEAAEILAFLKGFDLSQWPWIERHPLDGSEG